MTYVAKNHAVGAIHESPAVGTIDIAPHQSLPCVKGGGQNLLILTGGVALQMMHYG